MIYLEANTVFYLKRRLTANNYKPERTNEDPSWLKTLDEKRIPSFKAEKKTSITEGEIYWYVFLISWPETWFIYIEEMLQIDVKPGEHFF